MSQIQRIEGTDTFETVIETVNALVDDFASRDTNMDDLWKMILELKDKVDDFVQVVNEDEMREYLEGQYPTTVRGKTDGV